MTALGVMYQAVDDDIVQQRLDNFLFRRFNNVPKSRVYRAIRDGEVRVNKKRIKHSYRLQLGDIVRLPPLFKAVKSPQEVCIHDYLKQRVADSIVYEDAHLIAVNKPSGIAVHGGSGVAFGMIEIVRSIRPLAKRLDLVHRLDKETSGCLLLAKSTRCLRSLHQQLREKMVEKTYQALVYGIWPKKLTCVDVPLHKQPLADGQLRVVVDVDGKKSLTRFKVLDTFNEMSLLEVKPQTGRTHQIRVHTQWAGHPIVGDDKYPLSQKTQYPRASAKCRLLLHAESMCLFHNDQWLTIRAPMQDDWQLIVSELKA